MTSVASHTSAFGNSIQQNEQFVFRVVIPSEARDLSHPHATQCLLCVLCVSFVSVVTQIAHKVQTDFFVLPCMKDSLRFVIPSEARDLNIIWTRRMAVLK